MRALHRGAPALCQITVEGTVEPCCSWLAGGLDLLMKILIADDNPDDVLLISTWLARAGHDCTYVKDGEAALEHLQQEHPDLILSDILMPKLDGFGLCRSVKADPVWRNIAFVFCTATYTDEQDAALAMKLGAQRFLTKPVDPERLQAVLDELDTGSSSPITAAEPSALTEPAYLQLYNQRLVSKLSENYRQLRTTVAELRRQNRQLHTVTESIQTLSAAASQADVERRAVQQTLELTQAETAMLIIMDRDDFVIIQAVGRQGNLLQGLVLPRAGSLCGQLLDRGETLIMDTLGRDFCAAELFLGDPPGSMVVTPLFVREATAGLLIALHSQPDKFDAATLQSCRLLAQHVAIAWENARLITALRQQSEALQQSQEQLIHNARMATVGRLTAAFAHEINNPLQSILGSVQLVMEGTEADAAHRPYLELAAAELDRVSDILERMVGFYRRDTGQRQPLNINDLLKETLNLAEKQLQRHHVAVITDLSDDLPYFSLSPNQFKQVFLNLILNAADAMPDGGQLYIVTRCCQQEEVEIIVRDTGPGILLQEQERIFESFYTTKPDGTGLGLSISRDIVTAHHGRLIVESTAGEGATFKITLPVDGFSR